MNRTKTPNSTTPNRLKAALTLLAIFLVTGIATFGGHLAVGRNLDTQPTEGDLIQARADAIAAIPQLPKDTEDKLATALYPQLAPVNAAFSDPIADRGAITNSMGQPMSARTPASLLPAVPSAPPVPEKHSRLSQWQQSVRSAATSGSIPPSITTAYLVSEVSPTGRVNMNGAEGAWLYIDSEKRQIPANIGAKFFDGILASINPDPNVGGVVFRMASGQTKMIHWDHQEDISSTTTIPTAAPAQTGNGNPPVINTPQQKPVSRVNSFDQPLPQKRQPATNEYSDLQVAVKDRYQTITRPISSPVQPGTGTSNLIAPEQPSAPAVNTGGNFIITPTVKTEAIKSLDPLPNTNTDIETAFSTTNTRGSKLNYAHAVYRSSTARKGHAALALRNRNTLNLDAPTYFNPQPTQTSLNPSLDQASASTAAAEPAIATTATTDNRTAPETQTQQKEAPKPAPEASKNHADGLAPSTEPPAVSASPERKTLCSTSYRGENITITNESNRPLSLLNLVNRLNEAYGANIVLDYDIQETPVRLTINNAPWTSILRTLLDLNDLDMVCLDGGIVQIAKRSKITSMGDLRRRSAPIIREVFKLSYVQQTAGGRANLAGQQQATNGATIQSLEDAIRDILKAGGDPRGEARRVPGRNQLMVAATHEQMDDIRDLIARVDRPGYQVKISALVYTANENRLREIGSQFSIVVGNAQGTNLVGATTLAPTTTTTTGTGGSTAPPPSGINPGGIPGLATGMRVPSNGLGATSPLATFGGTGLFGTAQFAYQLTLAAQKGIVNIQSRPFGTVSDGDTWELIAGTQIPVVTTTIAGGAPFQAGQVQFIEASRIARITPQVAEDDKGNPNYVTLNIQLENNSVDTSLGSFNGVPGVNRQSLQTVLRLRNGETVVIGGLAADQVSNAQSKVPGLGSIPILGHLFKKQLNQESRDRLYFAITVEVIAQDAATPNFQAPADAMTTPPSPPRAQKPSPYRRP